MEAIARGKGIGIAEQPVELIYALDERAPLATAAGALVSARFRAFPSLGS